MLPNLHKQYKLNDYVLNYQKFNHILISEYNMSLVIESGQKYFNNQ